MDVQSSRVWTVFKLENIASDARLFRKVVHPTLAKSEKSISDWAICVIMDGNQPRFVSKRIDGD